MADSILFEFKQPHLFVYKQLTTVEIQLFVYLSMYPAIFAGNIERDISSANVNLKLLDFINHIPHLLSYRSQNLRQGKAILFI